MPQEITFYIAFWEREAIADGLPYAGLKLKVTIVKAYHLQLALGKFFDLFPEVEPNDVISINQIKTNY